MIQIVSRKYPVSTSLVFSFILSLFTSVAKGKCWFFWFFVVVVVVVVLVY
jgi:hypothetical protein